MTDIYLYLYIFDARITDYMWTHQVDEDDRALVELLGNGPGTSLPPRNKSL